MKYTHINQIYEELMRTEEEKIKKEENFEFRPITTEDYVVPEFIIPQSNAKGFETKLRDKLSKVLTFIDVNKHRRSSSMCTIMSVPTTNKKYVSIFGSHQNVSNGIKFMQEIGLLSLEDPSYQFKAYYDKDNKAKTYRYYVENERLILDYCKQHNIDKKPIINHYVPKNIPDIALFDKSGVRISSSLHLLKPTNWSKEQFKEYLKQVLHENYPMLEEYEILADEINSEMYRDYPQFQISYDFSFEWTNDDKAVTKIGLRATNSSVSAKKKEVANDIGFTRKDILRDNNLNLEYDVNSSVPRLTLSMNLRHWINEYTLPDIYKSIYSQYIQIANEDIEEDIQYNSAKVQNYNRDAIKKLFMNVYFDNTTDKNIGNHVRSRMNDNEDKESIYEQISYLKQATYKVIGEFDYSEIFYHESNIYMKVLYRLMKEDYFVWQVYDSWYARKENISQDEYEKHVSHLVEEEANKYFENSIV